MCLNSKLILNPKYKKTKKNGGIIPPIKDQRVKYVPIGCNECIECRKALANEWMVRLLEDIKTNTGGKFITLTFSDEAILKLSKYEKKFKSKTTGKEYKEAIENIEGYDFDNEIATVAMRLFNERWRKKYGKAIRHWTITELGHQGTENIHLHGIVWCNEEQWKSIEDIWQYGWVYKGRIENGRTINYVNEHTASYMTKYIAKVDEVHKTYKARILTSPGIGANYTETWDAKNNKYNGTKTREYYRTRTGHKMGIPIYWRNKIYSEEEREKLWIQKLDKEERWVMGEKISIKETEHEYWQAIQWYRRINKTLGYGDGEKNQDRKEYEKQRREIMQETRIRRAKARIREKVQKE